MGILELKPGFYFTGALDHDLRVFDIIMYTEYGTTYNSYVLKTANHTVLFETAKAKCLDSWLEKVAAITPIDQVDYLVVSHTEPDHSGSVERLLDLTFDCTDEMGRPTQTHLILEIMGCNSNLILTAEDGRILDCLRRVDFEMSEQRQVLPGLYYHLPPTQGKRDPFAVTQEELTALLAAQRSPRRLDGWLLDTFGGFSPLVCRELAFCLTGDLDTDVSELPEAEKTALAARLHARIEQLRTQPPQPVLLEKDGRPWDFTCLPVTQYGDFVRQEAFDSFSRLLDRC